MGKSWIGYVASAFIFISGVLELLGGFPKLGIFLIILSIISLILRIYFIKKINGGNDDHKGI